MHRDFTVVASCSDGASCTEAIRFLVPDVALVDAALPDVSRQRILAPTKAVNPRIPTIFFAETTCDSDLQRLALEGACIVLPKAAIPEMLIATLAGRCAGRGSGLAHRRPSQRGVRRGVSGP